MVTGLRKETWTGRLSRICEYGTMKERDNIDGRQSDATSHAHAISEGQSNQVGDIPCSLSESIIRCHSTYASFSEWTTSYA